MGNFYLKPKLIFFSGTNPATGVIIQSEYEKANSYEAIVSLVHKWLNKAECEEDDTTRFIYERSAKGLFSILTNRSLDSRISI